MKPGSEEAEKIITAVITGRHAFDVPAFHRLFRSIAEVDFYPQHLENFVADEGKVRTEYDVVVFYNYHQKSPVEDNSRYGKLLQKAFEELGETGCGIFVLHHAIMSFANWQIWSEICGIKDRSFDSHRDQRVRIEIADANHPVTVGLEPWEMLDETYKVQDAGEDCDILLTTSHPRSMRTIARTRRYRRARVLCLQSGHDNRVYANPNFRAVVTRGIQWLARR